MVSKAPQQVDMGLIEHGGDSLWFGQVLSSGFDSLVNARANRIRHLRGKTKYVLATFLELARFVPQSYEVSFDGDRRSFNAMVLAMPRCQSTRWAHGCTHTRSSSHKDFFAGLSSSFQWYSYSPPSRTNSAVQED